MALGSLSELEEMYPTASRPSASELYKECMSVNDKVFHGRHIYPYIFCGSWHARQGRSSQALIYWAEAAQVLRYFQCIFVLYFLYLFPPKKGKNG